MKDYGNYFSYHIDIGIYPSLLYALPLFLIHSQILFGRETSLQNTMEFDNNTICDDDTDYHFNQEIADKYAGIYDPDVLEVLKDCDEVCSRSPIKKEYLH